MSARDTYIKYCVQHGSTFEQATAAANKLYPLRTTQVRELREIEAVYSGLGSATALEKTLGLATGLAADLLEMDGTAIELDNWPTARALIEHVLGEPLGN